MTLLYIDSFDHYAAAQATMKGWTGTAMSIQTGRTGSCARWVGQQVGQRSLPASIGTVIVGFAFRTNSYSINNVSFLNLLDTGTKHIDLRIDSGGHIYITRNGTTLGTCGTVISLNTWLYLELKVNISDTVGAPVIRINNVAETITWVTGTSSTQDTRNGANASVNQLQLGSGNGSGSVTCEYDDLYICDTAGSVNNDFLGDIRVSALMPTGAGTYTDFTPSTGSNWQNVDDATTNSDTDYNSATTSGLKDTYTYSDLTSAGTVYGIQHVPNLRKATPGMREVTPIARISSTDYDLTSGYTLNDSYVFVPKIVELNPATSSAWDSTTINAAEFGIDVTA